MPKEESSVKEFVRVNVHVTIPSLPAEDVISLRTGIKKVCAEYSAVRVDVTVTDILLTLNTLGQ